MSANIQELKRIADSVDRLRGHVVQDVMLRSDCCQLRITLDDGQILIVNVLKDDDGKPRLDVDLVRPEASAKRHQLEVAFDETASKG
ncbi:MAG: hypothetical protein ACE5FJ_02235 [Gemmatimonadales bacterium]